MWLPALACAVSVVGSISVITRPALALLAAAGSLGAALLSRPLGRLVFVIGGGLAVLQGVAVGPKLAYAAGVAVCLIIAGLRLPAATEHRPEIRLFFAPLLAASCVMAVVLALNFVSASYAGIGTVAWFRDALPYALLPLLPVVGLDAASASAPRNISRLVAIALALAPLAFMTDWLNRRGASNLGVGRIALASYVLCAAAMAFGLSQLAAGGQRRRPLWLLFSLVPPVALLLTGTRSSLALTAVLFGSFGSPRKYRLPVLRTAAVASFSAFALVLVIPIVGDLITSDSRFYAERFAGLAVLSERDALQNDLSFQDRSLAYGVALDLFREAPLRGVGLGYDQALGGAVNGFDTPLAALAKMGCLGAIALICYAAAWIVILRRLAALNGPSPAMTAVRAFSFGFLAYLPLASAFEDKGLALSAAMFAAILPQQVQDEARRREAPAVAASGVPMSSGRRLPHMPPKSRQYQG